MNAAHDHRTPRSIRKYLRREKARLRRQLPPAEAARAVDALLRAVRRRDEAARPAGVTEETETE
jgi:hypothetical protein